MTLFEYEANTRARNSDPETSHRAAALVAPKLSKLQKEVLQYFTEAHELGRLGVTDDELVRHFSHLKESTARKRRSELTHKFKLIVDSGERRWVDGSMRVVWRLANQPIRDLPF